MLANPRYHICQIESIWGNNTILFVGVAHSIGLRISSIIELSKSRILGILVSLRVLISSSLSIACWTWSCSRAAKQRSTYPTHASHGSTYPTHASHGNPSSLHSWHTQHCGKQSYDSCNGKVEKKTHQLDWTTWPRRQYVARACGSLLALRCFCCFYCFVVE